MHGNKVMLTAILALVPVTGHAIDGWARLKTGMTRTEASAVLGAELMASKGRGFEVAIYDGRAEVVFLHGQVVAWTAPATSEAAPAPEGTWQFDQAARSRVSTPTPMRSREIRRDAILPAYRL